MNIYSLFDRKLKQFGAPAMSPNNESVKRELRDAIPARPDTLICKYPEDFDLVLLGSFDQDTGVLVPEELPTLVDNIAVILGVVVTPIIKEV